LVEGFDHASEDMSGERARGEFLRISQVSTS
jgi:hypothetical protein